MRYQLSHRIRGTTKAVYAGTSRHGRGYDEAVVNINLPPFHRKLPVIRAARNDYGEFPATLPGLSTQALRENAR
jgi:hypothetical protein